MIGSDFLHFKHILFLIGLHFCIRCLHLLQTGVWCEGKCQGNDDYRKNYSFSNIKDFLLNAFMFESLKHYLIQNKYHCCIYIKRES